MKQWRFKYKEHDVEIRNGWIKGEALIVDGELQDQRIGCGGTRIRLYGSIKSGQGQGELIKVSLGGCFTIGCVVFIDDREVFRS